MVHHCSVKLVLLWRRDPAGSTDPRLSSILTGLSCTAFPMQEALYKQLVNLHLLCRESMLRAAGNRDAPTLDILMKAPLEDAAQHLKQLYGVLLGLDGHTHTKGSVFLQ